MSKLTLENVITYLGQPHKKCNHELIWQCPICKDRGKDNLKYNIDKNVLYCFANSDHSKTILKEININNGRFYIKDETSLINKPVEPANLTLEQTLKYEDYMYQCNEILLRDKNLLKFLYDKRGITPNTVSMTKLGYDKRKQIWTIPTIKYSCNSNHVIGFEFRPHNLSKIGLYRTKGSPSCLAMINDYYTGIDTLCVIEGYFDGYALLQYLSECKEDKYYHIVTPSNGVQSLMKFMPDINYNKYKKYYLFIDNDEVSNKIKSQIVEKYPQFEKINMICDCKDFNEHYLKCIKGRK